MPTSHNTQPEQSCPKASSADVDSIESIVTTIYHVISFEPGSAPDWPRLRTLFVEGARLIPPRPADGRNLPVLEVEEFITGSSATFSRDEFISHGFKEREISARIERFGNIAHVFSTCESRYADSDAPLDRGINSIQLWFDGKRWWVVSVFWDRESAGHRLPGGYLPAKQPPQ